MASKRAPGEFEVDIQIVKTVGDIASRSVNVRRCEVIFFSEFGFSFRSELKWATSSGGVERRSRSLSNRMAIVEDVSALACDIWEAFDLNKSN